MLSDVQFTTADYVVCALALCISLAIGIYYAISGGQQGTTAEYHLGNRNLNFLPVMLSLMVTSQSSILILGVPAETYLFGFLATFAGLGFWGAYWISARIIIPVVYPLGITSVNEYFELRYRNNRVRILTTTLSFLFWFIYIGIVTYGVSTAIETVLGAPVWMSIIIVSMGSMIYTAIGGIKAVIWTDVIQYTIMMISVLAILIKGSMKVGGGSEVLRINSEGGRLNIWNWVLLTRHYVINVSQTAYKFSFGLSPDPTLRYTLWNVAIGNIAKLFAFPLSQSSVQRIGCMPSIKEAYKLFFVVAPLMGLTVFLAGSMGLVAYAYFVKVRCDPLKSKFIGNPNQILPTLVSEIFQENPGLTGLFIAGLFSASLSTVSSGLCSIVFYDPTGHYQKEVEKYIRAKVNHRVQTYSQQSSSWLFFTTWNLKTLKVVVVSFLTTGMALLLASVKGTLLKLAQMVLTIPTAPFTGIMLYSIFCTSATTAGALAGGLTSLLFYLWMAIGNIVVSPPSVEKKLPPAPVDQCTSNYSMLTNLAVSNMNSLNANLTDISSSTASNTLEGFSKIYTLSFQWFDVIAIFLVIVIGLIVSKVVGAPDEKEVDARYVLSFIEQFSPYLPEKVKHILSCGSTIPKRRKQIQAEECQDNQQISIDDKSREEGL